MKMDIGSFTATQLIHPNEKIFVATGTTAAVVGIEVLARNPSVRAFTHSVPFAWHFMEFVYRGLVGPAAGMEIVDGLINPVTGMIENSLPPKIPSDVFLYSPHGVNDFAITGNRDVEFLKFAMKRHSRVLFLATHSKLLREGSKIVKHVGHIEKEIGSGRRTYEIVVPQRCNRELKDEETALVTKTISALKNVGVVVHRAPAYKESVWVDSIPS